MVLGGCVGFRVGDLQRWHNSKWELPLTEVGMETGKHVEESSRG